MLHVVLRKDRQTDEVAVIAAFDTHAAAMKYAELRDTGNEKYSFRVDSVDSNPGVAQNDIFKVVLTLIIAIAVTWFVFSMIGF